MSTRFLTAPDLSRACLSDRVTCYRPKRLVCPNLSLNSTQYAGKLIAHNYGHGGAGWTMGPGAAQYIVNCVKEHLQSQGTQLSRSPVCVIGGGCIGLFTVLELFTQGCRNIRVTAEQWEQLASNNAGNLLAPVSFDSDDPKLQATIDNICIEAYKYYELICNNRHPLFRGGVRKMPIYFNRGVDHGLTAYVGRVMSQPTDVVVEFNTGAKRELVEYKDGIWMDNRTLMRQMQNMLDKWATQGILRKETRRVNSFSEVSCNVIFNCTGLGSLTLNNDASMIPVQGHLILLQEQHPVDLQYMVSVYGGYDKLPSGFINKPAFYFHPKVNSLDPNTNKVGMIGGSFIEGATAEHPHIEQFEEIIHRAREFFGLPHDVDERQQHTHKQHKQKANTLHSKL